jgi:DNA polymerase delta subunit 1
LTPWDGPLEENWKDAIREECQNSPWCTGGGEELEYSKLDTLLYEDNIRFEDRYCVDHGMTGTAWMSINIPDDAYENAMSINYKKTRVRKLCVSEYDMDEADMSDDQERSYEFPKSTRCEIEVQANHSHITHHNSKTAPWDNKVAPFRIGSFDIECVASKKGMFPTPTTDQVVNVAFSVRDYGRPKMIGRDKINALPPESKCADKMDVCDEGVDAAKRKRHVDFYHMDVDDVSRLAELDPEIKSILAKASRMRDATQKKQSGGSQYESVIFTLKKCAHMEGVTVYSFDDERDQLLAVAEFISQSGINFLTGYNIFTFDIDYLFKRAIALGIEYQFLTALSKVKGYVCWGREKVFESSARGRNIDMEFKIPGLVLWDMYKWIKSDSSYKLRSYTLNSVSTEFLKQEKEDVHHSIIPVLFNGTDEDRRRLADYCKRDAQLPQELMDKLMTVIKEIENCRLTGIQFKTTMERGQSIKVLTQVLGFSIREQILLPHEEKSEKEYQGADVLDPVAGFYDDYVVTLDFASLYPSIMIAHNLCFTTQITESEASKMNIEDFTKTPAGHYFVKAHVKKGILPMILEVLLKARGDVKKLMAVEKDPFVKAQYDARQLALKISANSAYGFTGAPTGAMYTVEVAESVTAYGREMIQLVKYNVEKEYSIANGKPYDAKVLYGDTDSVMVRIPKKYIGDMHKMFEFSKQMSKFATGLFGGLKPISMEFEKVYYPFLLIAKKNYVGVKWLRPDKPEDKIEMKGIEAVKRDTTIYVQEVMKTCIHDIIIKKKPSLALEHARKAIEDIRMQRVPIHKLIITKQLNGNADEFKTKQAQAEVQRKMMARDPGTAPRVGERVPYVVIENSSTKLAEKAEDPLYVIQNGISIDADFYLQNRLMNPLYKILGRIYPNVERLLLSGDHFTRKKDVIIMNNTGIKKFFNTTVPKCVGCNKAIHPDKSSPKIKIGEQQRKDTETLCPDCRPKMLEILAEVTENDQLATARYSSIYSMCQACRNDDGEVLCMEKTCDEFYKRREFYNQARDARTKLDRMMDMTW